MTELAPPKKRKPKYLAWIYCLVYPLQWLRDLFYGDYKTGAVYPDYNPIASYQKGDRVIGADKAVYECLFNGTSSGSSGPYNSPDWVKTQDVFIGTDERVKYNSQLIILEYALNHYYRVPNTDPQIYLLTNPQTSNVFLMANSSGLSSLMTYNPLFAQAWMPNVPVFVIAEHFTVFVPTLLFATLGTTTQDRENNIRQFVNKYKLAGTTYDVQTF